MWAIRTFLGTLPLRNPLTLTCLASDWPRLVEGLVHLGFVDLDERA